MKYIKTYESWLIKPEVISPNITSDEFYLKFIQKQVISPGGFNDLMKSHEYTKEDFDEIVKTLEEKCGTFLEELKKLKQYPLLRGVKNVDDTYTRGLHYKTSYTNRQPTDLDVKVSETFDDKFYDKFGVKIRSSGVFASKCLSISSDYGATYLFFPIGNYRYFWNPNIDDLYSSCETQKWYHDYTDGDSWGYQEDGVWSYNGEEYSTSLEDSITDAKEANSELRGLSNDRVSKMLVWIPELTYKEFMENINAAIDNETQKLVDGYKEGELNKVYKQELTFICKDYYLVDVAFYTMFMEYLKLKPSN